MAQRQWPMVINLGNSIIGVSVLAMPYCFAQCGIILGTLLLLASAWLTSVSCTLLMNSALTAKRRSFEFLALHSYGPVGKLTVELSSIGLLIGTCVAFYVVIGDLGPGIISKVIGVENSPTLRTVVLVFVAGAVVAPLGLVKDIESLNNISAASICFYVLLVSSVIIRAVPNILAGVWIDKVNFWRINGILKCLPIFSMSFGCQTQLFLMYNALSEPSLKQIVSIVKGAVGLCTCVYLSMGFFGYVAYCDKEISGDILMDIVPTAYGEMLKMGFILSIAVSFPLVIFPCRSSIQMLLFAPRSLHDTTLGGGLMRVREMHFRTITFGIIVLTLGLGLAIPNIELILGLTGSTMGSVICFVFPALIFLRVMPISPSNSRNTAKIVLLLGITILFASTYTTLQSAGTDGNPKHEDDQTMKLNEMQNKKNAPIVKDDKTKVNVDDESDRGKKAEANPVLAVPVVEMRQEPPIPQPPDEKHIPSIKHVDPVADKHINPNTSELDAAPSTIHTMMGTTVSSESEKEKKIDENLKKQGAILAQLQQQQKHQEELLVEQKKLLVQLQEHGKSHQNEVGVQPMDHQTNRKQTLQPMVDQPKVADQPMVGDQSKEAEQPIVGDRSKEAFQPLVGDRSKKAEQPLVVDRPKEAEQPLVGDRPKEAEQPLVGDRPKEAEQPMVADQSKKAEQPKVGDRSNVAEQPMVSDRPKESDQPMVVDRPKRAEQPIIGDRSKEADHPMVVDQPKEADQPMIGDRPKRADLSEVDVQPNVADQPIVDKLQGVAQPIVNQPKSDAQPIVDQPKRDIQPIVTDQPKRVAQPIVVDQHKEAVQPIAGDQPKIGGQPIVVVQHKRDAPLIVDESKDVTQTIVGDQPIVDNQQIIVDQPKRVAQPIVTDQPKKVAQLFVDDQSEEAVQPIVADVDKSYPSDTINRGVPSDTINRGVPSDTINRGVPSDTMNQGVPSDTINQRVPEVTPHLQTNASVRPDKDPHKDKVLQRSEGKEVEDDEDTEVHENDGENQYIDNGDNNVKAAVKKSEIR